MSIGSKKQRARQTARRRRDKAKWICAIDFEVRNPMNVLGNHDRLLLAYASPAGLTEVVLIHEGTFDLTRATKIMDDFASKITETMSVRDERVDRLTGRVHPVVNNDEEEI